MRKASRGIWLVACVLFQGAFLSPSFAIDFNCPEIDNIQLTPDETAIIQAVKAKDDLAQIGTLIVILGPAMDCITSHPLDCLFSVTTDEWDKIAAAPGNLTKIAAATNQDEIGSFLVTHQSTKNFQFLQCLYNYYGQVRVQ